MGKSKKRVTITDIKSNYGKLSPLIVNFEHGEVDPNAIEKYQAKMKIGMPENVELKENLDYKGPQLKVQIESDHLTYSSSSKTLKGSGFRYDPYYATYIGVRNKTDGTMKLYEVDQVTVAANVPAPPTKNPTLLMAKELEQETDEAKKRAAAKKHLVTEFGQTKGQRMYAQADRMAVTDENLAEKLSKAADNVDLAAITLPHNPANDANPTGNLTPPCNRQAGRKEEVYNMFDILSKEEIEALQNCVPEVAKQFEEEPKGFSLSKGRKRMITNFLEDELKQYNKMQNLDKLAVAIYVDGIFQFLNMKGNHFSAGPRGLPEHIPIFLRQKIFDNFTDQGKICPEARDRGACYAMILALIINNFVVEFSQISSSLKSIRVPALKKLITVIGAIFHQDAMSKKSYIMLNLPLTSFDPNKVSRARGKKK